MKIGTMELVVILLIAFLVLGPDKTLAYTRKVGKGLRTLRVYVNSFTEDIKETVTDPLQELAEPLNDLTKPLDDLTKAVQQPVDKLNTDLLVAEAKLNSPVPKKPAAPKPAAETAESQPETAPEETPAAAAPAEGSAQPAPQPAAPAPSAPAAQPAAPEEEELEEAIPVSTNK